MAVATSTTEVNLRTQRRTEIQSPGQRALRRFLRHRLAVISMIFMVVVTLLVFPLAPVLAPSPPEKTDLRAVRQPPSLEHPLGTDLIGRDVLSRVLYGGRVSIAVGLTAVVIFMTIGTLLGSLAGYYGGKVDALIMRITDTFMAFPVLVILISIVAIVGPGLRNAMIPIVTIIGLQITALLSSVVVVEVVFAWPGLGRLALNAVLDRDYPLLQGTVLVMAAMLTLTNLAVDLIYFFIDPRVEYA